MQPALVLAALALSVLFTGSEAEGGQARREKAGMLRDLAQAAMESSLAVGWIDINLAKAAWVRENPSCPERYTVLTILPAPCYVRGTTTSKPLAFPMQVVNPTSR